MRSKCLQDQDETRKLILCSKNALLLNRFGAPTGFSDTLQYCTALQCSPLRRKFMESYIIKPAQSLLTKRLVIGQR